MEKIVLNLKRAYIFIVVTTCLLLSIYLFNSLKSKMYLRKMANSNLNSPPFTSSSLKCPPDSDIIENARRRKDRLVKACNSYVRNGTLLPKYVNWDVFQNERPKSENLGHSAGIEMWWNEFYYSELYHSIYCAIPKAGNTNVKIYLSRLENMINKNYDMIDLYGKTSRDNLMSIHGFLKHHGSKQLAYLDSVRQTNTARVMWEKYFKFVFFRDPLERLVSAWKDKLDKGSAFEYKKFAHKITETFRQKSDKKSIWPTLEVFFRYLASCNDSAVFDVHWRPQVYLAYPCEVDYDFIGLSDSLACELEYIARRISGHPQVPKMTRQSNNRADKLKLLETVPTQLILDVLTRHYSIDYELLGFEFPKF